MFPYKIDFSVTSIRQTANEQAIHTLRIVPSSVDGATGNTRWPTRVEGPPWCITWQRDLLSLIGVGLWMLLRSYRCRLSYLLTSLRGQLFFREINLSVSTPDSLTSSQLSSLEMDTTPSSWNVCVCVCTRERERVGGECVNCLIVNCGYGSGLELSWFPLRVPLVEADLRFCSCRELGRYLQRPPRGIVREESRRNVSSRLHPLTSLASDYLLSTSSK